MRATAARVEMHANPERSAYKVSVSVPHNKRPAMENASMYKPTHNIVDAAESNAQHSKNVCKDAVSQHVQTKHQHCVKMGALIYKQAPFTAENVATLAQVTRSANQGRASVPLATAAVVNHV